MADRKVQAKSASEDRIRDILSVFEQTYPDAHIMLTYGNPWELLVAVILSAQATDVQVNKVTNVLFTKYRSIADYDQAPLQALEADVRSTGFYKTKAKHIQEAAGMIVSKFRGRVPATMAELVTLPGVARKTANIVLYNAFNKTEGMAVDTHVARVSQRLRLVDPTTLKGKDVRQVGDGSDQIIDFIKDADPSMIESILLTVIPKVSWGVLPYRIIDHGRAICKAVKPKCEVCPLATLCPACRGR